MGVNIVLYFEVCTYNWCGQISANHLPPLCLRPPRHHTADRRGGEEDVQLGVVGLHLPGQRRAAVHVRQLRLGPLRVSGAALADGFDWLVGTAGGKVVVRATQPSTFHRLGFRGRDSLLSQPPPELLPQEWSMYVGMHVVPPAMLLLERRLRSTPRERKHRLPARPPYTLASLAPRLLYLLTAAAVLAKRPRLSDPGAVHTAVFFRFSEFLAQC